MKSAFIALAATMAIAIAAPAEAGSRGFGGHSSHGGYGNSYGNPHGGYNAPRGGYTAPRGYTPPRGYTAPRGVSLAGVKVNLLGVRLGAGLGIGGR